MIKKDLSIDQLVEAYLTERTVLLKEEILDELARITTADNFRLVIEKLKQRDDLHELEMSLYIVEIARPELTGLADIIMQLKASYKDSDALEDLEEAMAKIAADRAS